MQPYSDIVVAFQVSGFKLLEYSPDKEWYCLRFELIQYKGGAFRGDHTPALLFVAVPTSIWYYLEQVQVGYTPVVSKTTHPGHYVRMWYLSLIYQESVDWLKLISSFRVCALTTLVPTILIFRVDSLFLRSGVLSFLKHQTTTQKPLGLRLGAFTKRFFANYNNIITKTQHLVKSTCGY